VPNPLGDRARDNRFPLVEARDSSVSVSHRRIDRAYERLHDWRRALVIALANSEEFCDGGFYGLLGFT
jgi:hypothetical protein